MKELLSVEKLHFQRSEQVFFYGLDLSVQTGELWQIAGPNGIGKTTLLRLFAGLLTPTAGKIQLNSA